MKKDVIIRNVNEDLWNWFVGHCKQQGLKVGEGLEIIIKNIKKKGKI